VTNHECGWRKTGSVRWPSTWWASVVALAVGVGAQAAAGAESSAASADTSASCRAQVILSCEKNCTAEENMPADISLDFAGKTGSYCRGEQCDDGKLEFAEHPGQWDSVPYRVFTLTDSTFTVSGAMSMGTKTFFATTSDVGTLFGVCE
jgi:hypothetical protein